MLRYFRPRYFFLTLEKPPIIVSRKMKDEIAFSNFNKNINNLQNTMQHTDELKYYNQNFNLKSKVNWKFEW
tara:strand:- start:151 stop:363 length:213 start_codon:yes stop_codon:yes gene_type:complete